MRGCSAHVKEQIINRVKGTFHLVHTKGWDHPTIFHTGHNTIHYVTTPDGAKHGSMIPITAAELTALRAQYATRNGNSEKSPHNFHYVFPSASPLVIMTAPPSVILSASEGSPLRIRRPLFGARGVGSQPTRSTSHLSQISTLVPRISSVPTTGPCPTRPGYVRGPWLTQGAGTRYHDVPARG